MALTRPMLALVLLLQSGAAYAVDHPTKRERRAMVEVLGQFSPTTPKSEIFEFVDRNFPVLAPMTGTQKLARLEGSAKGVGVALNDVRRYAREGHVELAREGLRQLARLLARGVQTQVTPANEELYNQGLKLLGSMAAFHLAFWLGASLAIGPEASSGWVTAKWASLGIAIVWGACGLFLVGNPDLAQGTWPRRLAERFAEPPDWDAYWSTVAKAAELEDDRLRGVEDLRKVIGDELRGTSIERACASALISKGPNE